MWSCKHLADRTDVQLMRFCATALPGKCEGMCLYEVICRIMPRFPPHGIPLNATLT